MRLIIKNNEGITLVEVIVSVSILGALVIPLMNLFVMSAKLNQESNKEYKSILAAQRYIEEIKAEEIIDTNDYIFNSSTGSYERTVTQTTEEYGAEIIITPQGNMLYLIEVIIFENEEEINFLKGTMILQ